MKSIRLYAAGPLAMVATSGLFLVMQGLVGGEGEVKLDPVQPKRIIDVVQVTDPIDPKRKSWIVEPLEIIKIEDEWIEFDDKFVGPDGPKIDIRPTKPPKGTGPGFGGFGEQTDGDYLPVVRVSAQYPRRAISQGIEGYAVVELTVGAGGAVVPGSIIIVAAEPDGIFDKEAKKAAAKFKYKPRIVDGIAQSVSGVRYRFTFTLAE